jgi:hypothetical protein
MLQLNALLCYWNSMLISSLVFPIAFDELRAISIAFKFTSVRGRMIYSEKLLVGQRIREFFCFCWRWYIHTDHVRNYEVLLRVKEPSNILHEVSKRKANWIGHILRRNCLLQRVIEGKIEGDIEVRVRRGRRRRKLLDELKHRRGYCHMKEEALSRTIWRAGFGRGFGPVVRQTPKWMNVTFLLKL